ncbi:MAG: 2-oxo-4-hydroxy-4-carboxy-5-ureidoimidazoline decarboxylase [Lapillicoccus sp.]
MPLSTYPRSHVPDLADLNRAPAGELRPRLLALTTAPQWADALITGRPYADLDALLDTSDELIRSLAESQVDAALAGHPRIGESSEGLDHESALRSAGEQAGMADADTATRDAIARGNVAYEEKFGRIYLAAAAGRSADELLALLRDRLVHDPARELDVVRRELARITRLRLQDSWGDR